jgi:hypothetical protein
LEKTFGLLFYLKPARNQQGTVCYVYLRITVDGKVAKLSTKKLWNTERWKSSVGRPAKVVLICVNNKWLKKDPFQGFKLAKKEVVKNPLSRDELKRLIQKVFEVDRISQVGTSFCFVATLG